LIVLATYVWRDDLLIKGLSKALEPHGFRVEAASVSSISSQHVDIKQLILKGNAANSIKIIDIADAHIAFEINNLWRGRVDAITVNHSSVTIQTMGGPKDSQPFTFADIPSWLQLLPIKALVVDELSLRAFTGEGQEHKTQLSIDLSENGSQMLMRLEDLERPASLTVAVIREPSMQINADLRSGIDQVLSVKTFLVAPVASNTQELTLEANLAGIGSLINAYLPGYFPSAMEGVMEGSINAIVKGTLPSGLESFLSKAKLSFSSNFHISSLEVGDRLTELVANVSLSGSLTDGFLQLTTSQDSLIEASLFVSDFSDYPLSSGDNQFRIRVRPTANYTVNLNEIENYNLSSRGITELKIAGLSSEAEISFAFNDMHCISIQEIDCLFPLSMTLAIPQLSIDNYSLTNTHSILSGEVKSQGSTFHLEGEGQISLATSIASMPIETSIQIDNLALNLGDEFSVNLVFRTEDLLIHQDKHWLPEIQLGGQFELKKREIHFDLNIKSENAFALQVEGIHSLENAQGNGTLSLKPIFWFGSTPQLQQFYPDWPYPFDISQGEVISSATINWQQNARKQNWLIDGAGNLSVADLTGFYKSIFFSGAAINMPFEFQSDSFRTAEKSSFEVQLLDTGIAFTNLKGNLKLDLAFEPLAVNAELANFKGSVLEGEISLDQFIYDSTKPKNSVLISLSELDLNKVAKLAEYEDLYVEGRVSGEIPIYLSDKGIKIDQGLVFASGKGGKIQYGSGTNQSVVQDGNDLDIVNQILQNYHFTQMSSDIVYEETGDLKLAVKMRGANPDYQNGQPVHLNLNLENNILELLRSLTIGRQFTEYFEKSAVKPVLPD